jgi:hypothetical protein
MSGIEGPLGLLSSSAGEDLVPVVEVEACAGCSGRVRKMVEGRTRRVV